MWLFFCEQSKHIIMRSYASPPQFLISHYSFLISSRSEPKERSGTGAGVPAYHFSFFFLSFFHVTLSHVISQLKGFEVYL